MLKAFLIVWTMVAGLAATGLMYIVGVRPQTTVVAERLTAPASSAAASASSAPRTEDGSATPLRSATPPAVAAHSSPVPAASADDVSTGSIGSSPPKPATRTVRRVEERPEAPASNPQVQAAKPDQDARPAARERKADEPTAVAAADVPEPPTAPSRSDPTTSAALLPSDSEPKQARLKADMKPELAARPPRDSGRFVLNETVAGRVERDVANRALKERARAAKVAETARARERAMARRQARIAQQRARVAQRGSLDQLMDDFSRSGSDFMHERTIRVGSRYLVERTTRQGTQYFYQQR